MTFSRTSRTLAIFVSIFMLMGAVAAPTVFAQETVDSDGDGVEDEFDNCVDEPNPDQDDSDFDDIGDACDDFPEDFDNDGVNDDTDNCYDVPNPGQEDSDEDGIGDSCDDEDNPEPVPSTVCTSDPPANVQNNGLQNMGFETGSLDPWREGSKAEGSSVVGPDTFGTTTVNPWEGTKMARLGESADSSAESQTAGPNEICQDFVVDSATEQLAFNLFTYDYTGFDEFEVDVKVQNPSTGETLAHYEQQAWGPGGDTTLKTTGWHGIVIDLAGHVGETVRLKIAAGGTSDDLYAFWAYVDSAEELPPEVAPIGQVDSETGSVMVDPSTGQLTIAIPNGDKSDITISTKPVCEAEGAIATAATLFLNGTGYPMTGPDAEGNFTVTIPQDALESGELSTSFTCPDEATVVTKVGSIVLYDPSGIISNAATGEPIVGAEVTLFKVPGWEAKTAPGDSRPQTCQSNLSKDPEDPWNQPAPTHLGQEVSPFSPEISPNVNPFITNSIGYYGWDVAAGCWYVEVEMDGFQALTSPVVGVPPEVTDLDLQLSPPDLTPPNTKIKKGPKGKLLLSKAKQVKFTFVADEPVLRFKCKMDKTRWKKCTSPKIYKGLKLGRHVFKVRATDLVGNTDPTPAKRVFKIVRRL